MCLCAGVALPSATGCSGQSLTRGPDDSGDDSGDPEARPNWYEDMAPLVATNCQSCHTDGGIAPFSMDNYEETMPWSTFMAQQVAAGIMPPWHAVETETCTPPHPFNHDARLSSAEIQAFVDWADLGAPEGDPALAANLPPPVDPNLENPTVTIPMQGSISIEATDSRLDFEHCLSFDPGNTEDIYLDGIQVLPGNPKIAHHVLLFIDASGASASWDNGVFEDCGGGAGVADATLIGGWVPGSLPIRTPEGVGVEFPAGARIIYNYHYHATGGGPEVDDSSAITLRYSTVKPEWSSYFELVGAPGVGILQDEPFLIEAGAKNHEEIVDWSVPDFGDLNVRLWAAANHMHKVGVDMQTTVIRNGVEHCLVQTPSWDFNWQRIYTYDVPIGESFKIENGDIIRVRCTYDNTVDNPSVLEALAEIGATEPIDVALGAGTLDEMCLAGIGVARKNP